MDMSLVARGTWNYRKKLMVELKNLRKRLQERIDLEKNGKKEEITFSIEFMTLCQWIIHAGGISFEKAPFVLAFSQKLWTGKMNFESVPSETTLRQWEEWLGEISKEDTKGLLEKRVINFGSNLSKRKGEEVMTLIFFFHFY
jgi:hypothetical protein